MTTTCDNCGQLHLGETTIVKTVFTGSHTTRTFHFCSRTCMHEHHIKNLRRWEGDVHV
jgi:hypothetical protein